MFLIGRISDFHSLFVIAARLIVGLYALGLSVHLYCSFPTSVTFRAEVLFLGITEFKCPICNSACEADLPSKRIEKHKEFEGDLYEVGEENTEEFDDSI